MEGVYRTDEDLKAELDAQLYLLSKACREFDAGDMLEVRNMARALRLILTSDAHGEPSLWRRVKLETVTFPDTRIPSHPKNIVPRFSLTGIVLGNRTIGVRAFLEDADIQAQVPLDEWLEHIFADDHEGNSFSRHRLIKAVANLAGGTHFPSDIRTYYKKLEDQKIVATRDGTDIEITLRDVEKHSLRQIAFEVLHACGLSDGKGVRAEPGAILMRSMSMILYPGRSLHFSHEMRTKQASAPFANEPEHGLDSISGFMVRLPYEGTEKNSRCPCGSGLRFKQCCVSARDFDKRFIEDFERRHSL